MTFQEVIRQIENLKKENFELKKGLEKAETDIKKIRAEKKLNTIKERQLIPNLDQDMLTKLFEIDINPENGAIRYSHRINEKLFKRFWNALAVVYMPNVNSRVGNSAKYKFEPFSLVAITDEQFEIFLALINDVMKQVLKAKELLKQEAEQ